MHDHLYRGGGMEVIIDSDFLMNDIEKGTQELKSFYEAGGRSFVEMMPIGCGRSVNAYLQMAKEVPVNIIAATGFHKGKFYERTHFVHNYSVDQLTQLIVEEVTTGIETHDYNGPFVERSKAKAGIIKGGTGYYTVSPLEVKMLKAAARAHLETGAPIATHTEYGTMGLEQLEIFRKEGVNLERVVIGHLDRNPDPYYHLEVLKSGCYVQYDCASRAKYHSESFTVDLIKALVKAGYGKKIVFGGDLGRKSYFKAYGGGPGLAYILESFVPRLRVEGIPGSVIEDIWVNNPARILAF